MKRETTKLDDIAQLIAALSDMTDNRFKRAEKQMEGLEIGQQSIRQQLSELQRTQYTMNDHLDGLNGKTEALLGDVKELYRLTAH